MTSKTGGSVVVDSLFIVAPIFCSEFIIVLQCST